MLLTSARPPGGRPTRGADVIKWIETTCVGTVGKWAGKPARLMPWQRDLIMHLFEVDPATNRRVYRWMLLGVPKKNGKTELAAWLALYLLLADGETAPWIACAAASDYQADLVYGAASRCAKWSPLLSQVTEVQDKAITVPSSPGAKLVRVTGADNTNDGPSWHAVICDELHAWKGKNRATWEILTNGIGSRDQPLILQLTTAGFNQETVCGEQYRFGRRLADDPTLDPRYLFWWYEPAENARHDDPEVWRGVNPSWGITLPDPEAYLRDQLMKKTESVFRRFFMNQWVLSEDIWLPTGAWLAVEDREAMLDSDLALYVGVDGAVKRDTFSVVGGQRQSLGEVSERFVTRSRIWENPFPPGHPRRASWRLNLEEPLNFLRDLRADFPEAAAVDSSGGWLEGPAFGYDPRFLEYAAQRLAADGLNMIEVPQTDQRMCPAAETLYELIMSKRFAHDGDPDYRRQVHSATPKQKERGWRLTKPPGSNAPIDAAIALKMATYLAYRPGDLDDARGPTLW